MNRQDADRIVKAINDAAEEQREANQHHRDTSTEINTKVNEVVDYVRRN